MAERSHRVPLAVTFAVCLSCPIWDLRTPSPASRWRDFCSGAPFKATVQSVLLAVGHSFDSGISALSQNPSSCPHLVPHECQLGFCLCGGHPVQRPGPESTDSLMDKAVGPPPPKPASDAVLTRSQGSPASSGTKLAALPSAQSPASPALPCALSRRLTRSPPAHLSVPSLLSEASPRSTMCGYAGWHRGPAPTRDTARPTFGLYVIK